MRFAMLALMLFQLRAPARRPAKATAGAEGYYVLAYVLVIDPAAVPAPQYILNRVNDGPFDYPTAYARMLSTGKDGWAEGAQYFPVHTVQRVWIYYRCPMCNLE